MWQWIAIYLLLGGLAYYAIYYFILQPNGGYITPTTYAPSTTPASSETGDKLTINFKQTGFEPQILKIKVESTITWVNQSSKGLDLASAPHPTHTDYPPLNLGTIEPGASKLLTFPTAGTYKYHNPLNSSQYGSIVVE